MQNILTYQEQPGTTSESILTWNKKERFIVRPMFANKHALYFSHTGKKINLWHVTSITLTKPISLQLKHMLSFNVQRTHVMRFVPFLHSNLQTFYLHKKTNFNYGGSRSTLEPLKVKLQRVPIIHAGVPNWPTFITQAHYFRNSLIQVK